MTDYGHELLFGAFLPPDAGQASAVLALSRVVEELELDVLAFQDHPYQPGFLDTWTLLSFLDAIAAMGGPRRTAAENVDALEEAITIIRRLWTPGPPVHFSGRWYRLEGARPGPAPAHPIGIWLGAYKRRMLELTGRLADGWVPSTGYADPEDLRPMTRILDSTAEQAGRDPAEIRRADNLSGRFGRSGSGFLQGPPAVWAEQLTEFVLEHGMSTFILGPGPDAAGDLRQFAEEVARRSARRSNRPGPGRPGRWRLPRARPRAPRGETATETAIRGSVGAQTLLAVHEHLRQELDQLREVMGEVAAGRVSAARARSQLHQMTMRQNYWAFGAFCASYCRVVAVHHAIEDMRMFRDLRLADPDLGPVLERLSADHEAIAAVLTEVDDALVAMIKDPDHLKDAETAVDRLADALLPHLRVEEDQLLGPIANLGIEV